MTSADEEPRYEIKMVAGERGHDALRAALWLQPFGVRRLHPTRRVQSIYLDTHGGRALADNLAGISEREKIRFRWYGDEVHGVRGSLERKIRRNMLGTKETAALLVPLDVEGQTRRGFLAELCRQAPPAWRSRILAGLEVVQWIAYEREYLTTADRLIRITIDRALEAVDLRDTILISRRRLQPIPRLVVVECKAPQSARAQLEEVVQSFPMRADKCSKFVLGSAPTHAPAV